MVKRSGRDQRESDDNNDGTADRFRVDRVYVPTRQPPNATQTPRSGGTSAPPMDGDRELTLRHQVSKLQRLLADAQRELANKDDELAAEVEHRLLITAAR